MTNQPITYFTYVGHLDHHFAESETERRATLLVCPLHFLSQKGSGRVVACRIAQSVELKEHYDTIPHS